MKVAIVGGTGFVGGYLVEALVKAGLYDDAETLYQRLLKVTANESRKAMIQQEMQQIYLLRNASKATTEASAR